MEEEWMVYLRRSSPELYKQMIGSIARQAECRDSEIARLQSEIDDIKKKGEQHAH